MVRIHSLAVIFFIVNMYLVAGKKMNFDTLEHRVVRPLKVPLIHFAFVCAAASCPPLRPEAYRGEMLDKQLNYRATIFINNAKNNTFDLTHKQSNLSSIFKWFE
jgi:hypothetical protein